MDCMRVCASRFPNLYNYPQQMVWGSLCRAHRIGSRFSAVPCVHDVDLSSDYQAISILNDFSAPSAVTLAPSGAITQSKTFLEAES